MFENLAAGTMLVVTTSLIHGAGLLALSQVLKGLVRSRPPALRRWSMVGFMLLTVLGLFALHTIEIWVWATAYYALDALPIILRRLVLLDALVLDARRGRNLAAAGMGAAGSHRRRERLHANRLVDGVSVSGVAALRAVQRQE